VRLIQRYKQGRILILTRFQILLQVNLCAGIEVHNPLLVAFSEYDAFALIEIDIGTIQLHKFSDTHSG
jgi:hypothetical protein